MIRISKEVTFEASHVLPRHPGKCSRLHGHSWRLVVTVEGEVNPNTGFVVDYADLKRVINEQVVDKLDHRHLGQGSLTMMVGGYPAALGEDFYPSSENLVVAIAKMLSPHISELGVHLYEVTLNETCTCAATWRLGI